MPWNEVTTMSIKRKFIEQALENRRPFNQLCKEFKIGRTCGYKWVKRYQEQGKEGLEEKSRRPYRSPLKTRDSIEGRILNVRDQHPAWGGRKIHAYLTQKNVENLPDPSTITRILHRHSKISQENSYKRERFIRFEHDEPNQLWQMDFKGHFAMREGRCNPLTVLDDCSRFSLTLTACANQQAVTVKNALENVFREYGLPERITMDNGAPWGNPTVVHSYTNLEIWLIRLGIKVSHSRPFHPQTQGKDERFHRTLKEELLSRGQFSNLEEAQRCFDEWRECYNNERPHEALKMLPPITKYKMSLKRYPEQLPKIEYETGSIVRKVQSNGSIFYLGKRYFMSENMANLEVKIVNSERDGILEIFLGNAKIKEIDLINMIIARRII